MAAFIDAGYLFAQGSVALCGEKKSRANCVLHPSAALDKIKKIMGEKAAGSKILRVYWYDGSNSTTPTSDQASIAMLDDVKLRLGQINSAGQQKGVDSLIVTDLIELARLGSICDALLLSGDEDVRIGVQIAQSYGVRVHLLGIFPARGSQSQQLMLEADTTSEWSKDDVSSFFSLRDAPKLEQAIAESSRSTDTKQGKIQIVVEAFVSELESADLESVCAYWKTSRGVPSDMDRVMLAKCREGLGGDLEPSEKKFMRTIFQQKVTSLIDSNSS